MRWIALPTVLVLITSIAHAQTLRPSLMWVETEEDCKEIDRQWREITANTLAEHKECINGLLEIPFGNHEEYEAVERQCSVISERHDRELQDASQSRIACNQKVREAMASEQRRKDRDASFREYMDKDYLQDNYDDRDEQDALRPGSVRVAPAPQRDTSRPASVREIPPKNSYSPRETPLTRSNINALTERSFQRLLDFGIDKIVSRLDPDERHMSVAYGTASQLQNLVDLYRDVGGIRDRESLDSAFGIILNLNAQRGTPFSIAVREEAIYYFEEIVDGAIADLENALSDLESGVADEPTRRRSSGGTKCIIINGEEACS